MEEEDEIIMEPNDFDWEIKPPYHKFVWSIIKSVGWYIVGITLVLMYLWPHISKKISSWKKKKDDMEYDAKYHKDIDFNCERLLATQQAREKMQEKYLRDREIALQKEEERKERKRQELLKLQNLNNSGHRLNDDLSENSEPSSSSKPKTRLRGDYNPLMGGGSGRYVPPKRSRCGKGGCG